MPRTRSQSDGSERPSLPGFSTLVSPPTFVNPEPAYIAASAASQIVTRNHEVNRADWPEDAIEPSGETALVSSESLKLINSFLDQLLYNFLSIARSTSLVSLRPAVTEVLKPRLAREAITGADQELHEYLGGGEDEDFFNNQRGLEPVGPWDLDRVWMRTRLRCMVYSSLGDMEEEDEDRFMMEVDSLGNSGHSTDGLGYVSPAVAIFLTSILEFIGEQALTVAGQAAFNRAQFRRDDREDRLTEEVPERIVVEERDTEKVAFNATLGRLWRTWRKRLRTPMGSFSRSYPHPYPTSSIASTSRRSSTTNLDGPSQVHSPNASVVEINATVSEPAEYEIAAKIPLPIHENDIDEIEVPGLAELRSLHADGLHTGLVDGHQRHLSLMIFPSTYSEPDTPTADTAAASLSPSSGRKRANSLPTPELLPLVFPSEKLLHEGAISFLLETRDFVSVKTIESYTFKDSVKVTDNADSESDADDDEMSVVREYAQEEVSRPSDGAAGGPNPEGKVTSVLVYPDDVSHHEEEEDEEPEVMELQRVMFKEGMKSPSLVETRSRDNSSTRSLSRSLSTRSVSLRRPGNEETSTPRDKGESGEDQGTIGVARTLDSSASDEESASSQAAAEQTTKGRQNNPRFILGAPPAPRNLRRHENSGLLGREPTPSAMASSRPSSAEHGAPPPLTPLREMVEAAIDTSDEASVSATQEVPRFNPGAPSSSITGGHSPKSVSTSSSNYSQPHQPHQAAIVGSKLLDRRQQAGYVMERAAVQRLHTPPQTPRDPAPLPSPIIKGRRSGSFGNSKAQRPIHTSGSGTSTKLKGLIGWDAEKPPMRQRSDDEESIKAQSFDQLIRSDETIQYTLTPENVREIDDSARPSTQRSMMSVTRLNGLRVNPPDQSTMPLKPFSSTPSPLSPTLPPLTKPSSANPPLPRDARTTGQDSLREMAEFLRTTGPLGTDQTPSSGRTGTLSRSGSIAATTHSQVPLSPTVLRPIIPNKAGSIASSRVSSKSRLQARDAHVPFGDTSSDLIDFIRQGPPRDNGQSPRIPRTIAPFRNTMDSDRISAAGSRPNDVMPPNSPASLVDSTSQSKPQSYSSFNSQSGLLGSSSTTANTRSRFDGSIQPHRKQRRVPDPYAIDYNDDDDEEDDLLPTPKPKREEESLIEFLNSVPPPPAQQLTSSVFDGVPKPGPKAVQKKASAPSLMTRFVRTNSQTMSSPTTASPTPITRIPTGAPQLSLAGVGRDSPLMGSTPFPGSAGNGSVRTHTVSRGPTYVSHANLERSGPVRSSSISSSTYQPRSGRAESSRSNDLADFLKHSGPPDTTSTYTPPAQAKTELGFSKIFRKKKAVGYV
ncbi:MAG: hypothetical protein M1840_009147 [Geoglossum simile]|nr:MAG: hypothetical protein M1840_009147 [Geoglossum simile]